MQFYIYKFDKIRGGAFVMYQIAFSPWDEKYYLFLLPEKNLCKD